MARCNVIPYRGKVLIGISFLLMATCVPILLATEPVSAASGPKVIYGYVYDVDGNLYDGVTITVSVWNNANSKTTVVEVTADGGFYEAVFNDGSSWDIGKQYQVIADDGIGPQIPKTGTLDALGDQQVDIHYDTAIPQFGSALGFALSAGIIGAVAVVAVSRRHDS